MNNKRRQKIREITSKIDGLTDELEIIKEEEDDSRSNMPENLEFSVQYEKSETISETIEDAVSEIREALDAIENEL